MHDLPILRELVLVIAVSLFTVYLLRRLNLPSVVGFLLAGMIIGPGGLSLVTEREAIERLAEIGVVFLLFSVGLHFSLQELANMRGLVTGIGGLQVALTGVVFTAIAGVTGLAWPQAVLIGFLIAMSSTAIVIRLVQERGEAAAPHGRITVSVLIFQDLAVIPMMLLVPVLAGRAGPSPLAAALTVLQSLGVVAALLLVARFVYPWLLERVVRLRSSEMFTLTTILVALGTAYVAGAFGISLALGAFLAGVVISESDYSNQILTEMAPFRDAFSSLFFVSVGMLVEPMMWLDAPLRIGGFTALVVGLKALIVAAVVFAFGYGSRVAVLAALALAQVGEFSFILAQVGADAGLLPPPLYTEFLAVTVLTMLLTPFAIMVAPVLAGRAPRMGWLEGYMADHPRIRGRSRRRLEQRVVERRQKRVDAMSDHVIVVGYGVNGRNVTRVLRQLEVPYLVLELNPQALQQYLQKGELIQYGDATRTEILRAAGVERARVLVVAISDPAASLKIVHTAHRVNPDLEIVVRTRYLAEVDDLYAAGADHVVPEEFETSLELAAHVMETYGAPERVISREKEAIREERYGLLRKQGRMVRKRTPLATLLSSGDFEEVALPADSPAAGRTLRELELRGRTGASVIGVCREGEAISNPDADYVLQRDDLVMLFGTAQELETARALLAPEAQPEAPEPAVRAVP